MMEIVKLTASAHQARVNEGIKRANTLIAQTLSLVVNECLDDRDEALPGYATERGCERAAQRLWRVSYGNDSSLSPASSTKVWLWIEARFVAHFMFKNWDNLRWVGIIFTIGSINEP